MKELTWPIYLTLVLALGLTQLTRPQTAFDPKAAVSDRLWVTPPPQIERFHFGFREILADLLWLRVIQDIDVCNKPSPSLLSPSASGYRLPEQISDNEIAQDMRNRLLSKNVPRKRNCDYSWPFYMVDAITNLSPELAIVYHAGGMNLSVAIEDYAGAQIIFDKGIKNIKDWSLSYKAAYHYLYDVQDPEKAAELLIQAGDLGAPPWVRSLASRLLSMTGRIELALTTLMKYREGLKDSRLTEDVDRRIKILRSLLQAESKASNDQSK